MINSLLRAAVLSASAFSLVGCAVPQFDVAHNASGPTTHTIVQRITCELAGLLDKKDQVGLRQVMLSGNYVAAMKLELKVTNTGVLAPSLNFPTVGPFLSIDAGLHLSNQSTRSWFKYLSFSMRELDQRLKDETAAPFGSCPKGVNYNLEGELGLRDFVLLDISSRSSVGVIPEDHGKDGEFGGTVQFTLARNINSAGPTWTFEEFVGPGGLAKIDKTSVNTLTIAFVRAKPTKSKTALPTAADFATADAILRTELYQRDN